MKLTKLEHSGLVLEKDSQQLVFDPVEFAATLPSFGNVVAIIITHLHSDHYQPEHLRAILALNPAAQIFAPADAAAAISKALGLTNVITVTSSETAEVGAFQLRFFGENHASVVAGKVPCQNVGVAVDNAVVNPGDAYDLISANAGANVLLVPEVAPWTKLSETTEFMRFMHPQKVIPVHDGLLSAMGKTIYDGLLGAACAEIGAEFVPLGIGESIEV